MARAPELNEPTQNGKVPPTNARQGVTHHGVRYVLAISLLLVIIAFVLAYLYA